MPYSQLISATGTKCLKQQIKERDEYYTLHHADIKFWEKFGSPVDKVRNFEVIEAKRSNQDSNAKSVDFQYFEDIWAYKELKARHLYLYI